MIPQSSPMLGPPARDANLEHGPFSPSLDTVRVLNIPIHNISMLELLDRLKGGGTVYTPNVDHLVKLHRDPEFYSIYQSADYVVCDSQLVRYAAQFLGQPIVEKISGSDLFPAFYEHYKADESIEIFLLGAAPGVAERARQRINAKVGRNMVVAACSPSYGFEKNPEECEAIIEQVDRSGATVLAVGVGAPKQEKWIYKYRDRFRTVKTFLAIGATIEFEAGSRPRSPRWMSRVGLEWMHRLLGQPVRLGKRYLVEDPLFFLLVFQQRFNLYRTPTLHALYEAGLLSVDDIAEILHARSRYPDLPLEQIPVALGWLSAQTVEFFSTAIHKLSATKQPLPLGQHLKAAGLLTEVQIEEILAEQVERNLQFGELAIRRGKLDRATLETLLEQQARDRDPRPLGSMLCDRGLMTRSEVEVLLSEQAAARTKFGELAVLKGLLKPETVKLLLTYLNRR